MKPKQEDWIQEDKRTEQAVGQRCFMISHTRSQPYKAGQVRKAKKPEVAQRGAAWERERERERELTQIVFRRCRDAQQWQSHSYGSSTGTTTASLTDAKATLGRWGRWSRHSGVSNPAKELEETDRRHKKGRSPQSWNDTNLTGRKRTRHSGSRRNNTKNTRRLTRLSKKASAEQKNIYTLQQNTDAP